MNDAPLQAAIAASLSAAGPPPVTAVHVPFSGPVGVPMGPSAVDADLARAIAASLAESSSATGAGETFPSFPVIPLPMASGVRGAPADIIVLDGADEPSGRGGSWVCPSCTLRNDASIILCEACGTER